MLNQYRILSLFCFAGILTAVAVIADEPAAQKSLEQFNSLIGEWRGIGQPRRGSNAGAWKQTGKWVWDFSNDGVALQYEVTDGQLEQTGRLTFDPETSLYLLDMTTPDGQARKYQGDLVDDKLTLESSPDTEGTAHRITLTLLNENRTLVLHEQKEASQQRFFRVAEIGYTRAGVRLAKPGGGQPECIVTGGAGTIEVTYKGKTYYVCCSGCKQAFEDDPEGIIAEALKRRNQQQSKDN
ncbi:MAG: YHS domain-containing protein [Planctomycetaceae bacterium]|nr:YHS domain-containing protein [Planctomycetaceae bacterium]